MTKKPEHLRSARWFAPDDPRGFGHRSRMMQLGHDRAEFQGRPVIGILDTCDMLRIPDARIAGISCGARVLHVAPESFVRGPLALLRDGDIVRPDPRARRLDMLVEAAELQARRAAWVAPRPRFGRGWGWLYSRQVTQPDEGCYFDFPQAGSGAPAGGPGLF